MTTVTSFAKDFSRICGLLLVASAGLVSCSENDTPLPVESDSKTLIILQPMRQDGTTIQCVWGNSSPMTPKTFIMRGKVAITEGRHSRIRSKTTHLPTRAQSAA